MCVGVVTTCGVVTFLFSYVFYWSPCQLHLHEFSLQVDGNGNCLFSTIKKALGVRHKDAWDDPFYLTHYFRRQAVVWLVHNCQWVWYNKHAVLEANYSQDEETPSFKGPLTYKSYCRHLLDRRFWGDEVVLYAVSVMRNLWVTVFNSKTDEGTGCDIMLSWTWLM